MAKFYVQCGPRSLVIDAMDADAAAMHLVDLAMQPHLWIYDDEGLTDSDRHGHVMLEALLHMGTEIRVSEIGFHRSDAQSFGTPDTVHQWHQTMVGLARLMMAAGLASRPIRQLATATRDTCDTTTVAAASGRRLPR
ncbi:hypothetical protein LOC71_07920 [Rhodopirellula sp. JC740]|uniref:Uncharacterized protein n=1 Tax=Rhodopirellula halodulae TaxID=2894198 RepID=A0ABS8NF62_9BACT|nr:hypothetical protein [Rhodopirellula sp. JC740]MCC9642197.1 hypothetical protein [Rhodopirellula sp. JC740]